MSFIFIFQDDFLKCYHLNFFWLAWLELISNYLCLQISRDREIVCDCSKMPPFISCFNLRVCLKQGPQTFMYTLHSPSSHYPGTILMTASLSDYVSVHPPV